MADKPARRPHVGVMTEALVSDSDSDFDRALIAAAFSQAAANGWHRLSIAAAAREAGLSLDRAHQRFPSRHALLLRFGRMADQAALAETPTEGTVRDRLFDLIMRRIDFLQAHRAGVLALFRSPGRPGRGNVAGLCQPSQPGLAAGRDGGPHRRTVRAFAYLRIDGCLAMDPSRLADG